MMGEPLHSTARDLGLVRKVFVCSGAGRILRSASPEWACWALGMLGGTAFAVMVAALWGFTIDDAYIVFRYSRNLAEGYGLTWNPGEQPVEGYTGIVWPLLMSVPHVLNWDTVLVAKLCGVISALLCVFSGLKLLAMLYREERMRARMWAACAFAFWFLVWPATAIHAVAGLETMLYTFLLTVLFCCAGSLIRTGGSARWRAVAFALAGLATGLCRPEGNLAVVAAAIVLWHLLPSASRRFLIAALLLTYVLPGAVYFAWRWSYYQTFLPLPFYVKVGSKPVAGLYPVARFAAALAPLGLPVMFGLPRLQRTAWPMAAAAFSVTLFFCIPEHIMGYDYRFLFPVTPSIFAVAAVGAGEIVRHLGRAVAGPAGVGSGVVNLVIGILVVLFPAASFLSEARHSVTAKKDYAAGLTRAHVALGKRLSEFPEAPRRLLAVADAGAVPYYSRWKVIDTLGLNDSYIAKGQADRAGYIFDRKAELIVLLSRSQSEFEALLDFERPVMEEAIRRGFGRVAIYSMNREYHLWVMASPGVRSWFSEATHRY